MSFNNINRPNASAQVRTGPEKSSERVRTISLYLRMEGRNGERLKKGNNLIS